MTLDEARENIGRRVVYRTFAQEAGRDKRPPESGVIVRVGESYVFVRYNSGPPTATHPSDLHLEVVQ